MDKTTQQNAALVEEIAAAAESLKNQAQHLVGTVAVFKLAAQGDGARAPIAVQPVPHNWGRGTPRTVAHATKPTVKAASGASKPLAPERVAHADANEEWSSF